VGVANAGNGTSQLESVTDLQLTGRIAALGRGVQDVSNTMFTDFSRRLADRIATGTAEVAEVHAAAASVSQRQGPAPASTARVDHQALASSEIKLTSLVVSVARQRLADMFARWSEKLRP
jgi:hypothetical protein